MTETRALTLAGLAHLLLFAALSLTWSFMNDDRPISQEEPLEVEFMEISDMPAVTKPPEPSLAAAPRELVETPIEMDPLEDVQPEALPDLTETVEAPTPPEKKLEEKPSPKPKPPEPKPAEKPKPTAKPKPAPPKKQTLDAPVDKSKEIAERRREEDDFAKDIIDDLPVRAQLSAIQQNTLVGLIRQRIYKCWDPNAGGAGADKIVTMLRVKAAKDGTILGQPKVVKQSGSASDTYKRVARDAAIRAVLNPRCSLEGLPPELYSGGWDDFDLVFDPKDI